jgi:hypothetical protein
VLNHQLWELPSELLLVFPKFDVVSMIPMLAGWQAPTLSRQPLEPALLSNVGSASAGRKVLWWCDLLTEIGKLCEPPSAYSLMQVGVQEQATTFLQLLSI